MPVCGRRALKIGLCLLPVNRNVKHLIPVNGMASLCHFVVKVSCVRHTLCNIRSMCRDVTEDQLKPGDIVFFEGTMGDDVEGITHCGIYVGNHMMLHCGSPIGYVNLNDAYWQEHFHSYGRVPH